MDMFNTLFVMSFGSYIYEECKLDFIRKLPIELAVMILRKLEGDALVNACCVNKYWYDLCKSDKALRQKIRDHFREMKIRKERIILGDIGDAIIPTVPRDESNVFKLKNRQQLTKKNSVSVRSIPSRSNTGIVPFVVLYPAGVVTLNSQNAKRNNRGEKPVKGIPKSKKRRLLRL